MVQRSGRSNGVDRTECHGCGAFVSTRFVKVFGDNDGRVFGCQECLTSQELFEGAAVGSG